jgi:hypothetical protein
MTSSLSKLDMVMLVHIEELFVPASSSIVEYSLAVLWVLRVFKSSTPVSFEDLLLPFN